MSTNYRAYKITQVSGSCGLGPKSDYPRAWGMMKGQNNPSGSLTLEGGGTIDLKDIDQHQIFPCYPKSITIGSGTIMILE